MGEVGWGYKFVSNRLLKNVNKNLPSGLTYERDERYEESKNPKDCEKLTEVGGKSCQTCDENRELRRTVL